MSDALVQSATIQLKAQAGGGFGSVPSAPPVTGEPVISGVSGTFAQGNTLTISGSNFSANRSGQLIYENFDSGLDGDNINDIPSFNQNSDGATPSHQYKYDSTDKFSGSKSAFLDYTVGDGSGFRPQFDFGQNLNKAFVSMRIKFDIVSETAPDSQVKLPRIISRSGDHGSSPNPGITYENGMACYGNDGEILQLFYGPAAPTGWQNLFYYFDLGTTGNYDGSRFIKAFGSDSWTFSSFVGENFASTSNNNLNGVGANPTSWEPTGNIRCKTASSNEQFMRYLLLPFFKRAADTYKIWIDQVCINDSLESVFISSDANWTTAKANFNGLVVQPVLSRAESNITVSCEVGNLAGTRYLYVLNSNGVANEQGVAI